jgi:uncharacterized membrane protein
MSNSAAAPHHAVPSTDSNRDRAKIHLVWVLGFLFTIAISPNSYGGVKHFVSFDVPGAADTTPKCVNNRGVIVGVYDDQNGQAHGFIYRDRTFRTIDVPRAVFTNAVGINDRGQIVGRFRYADNVDHRYLLGDGVFHRIDYPGSVGTIARDINDKGQITGLITMPMVIPMGSC